MSALVAVDAEELVVVLVVAPVALPAPAPAGLTAEAPVADVAAVPVEAGAVLLVPPPTVSAALPVPLVPEPAPDLGAR